MRDQMNQSTYPSEEVMRSTRLARGLRAVAATLIVGGIVIAALDDGVPSRRVMPRDAPVGQVDSYGTAAPIGGPTGAEDPAFGRIDQAMEPHG